MQQVTELVHSRPTGHTSEIIAQRSAPQHSGSRLGFSVLAVAIATALLVTNGPTHAADKTIEHKAVQGDSIISIAQRLLEEPSRWREILGFNKGVKDPNRIQPGQTINIPEHLLKMEAATATVAFVAGTATSGGKPLTQGTTVGAGASIITGRDSAVTLNLQDGSKVLIQADTEIVLNELKLQQGSGARKQLFDLKKGRVEILAQPSRTANSRFEVRTPSSIAGVRGTVFRVASDPGNSKTEVLEGTVAASVQAQAVSVSGGFGTRIDQGQSPRAPRALLAAPAAPTVTRIGNPAVPVAFGAIPGAGAYRVVIARDASFSDVVRSRLESTPKIDFAGLAAGSYVLRLRAVDELGLEGVNRDVPVVIKIELPPPDISKAALPDARFEAGTNSSAKITLRWPAVAQATSYQIEIADNAAFNQAKVLTSSTTTIEVPMALAKTTTFYWRVRSGDGQDFGPASDAGTFTLVDANALINK